MALEDKKFCALKLMTDPTKDNASQMVKYSINVPDSAKGGQYRQLQSINAFRKLQADIRKRSPHWFILDSEHEFLLRCWNDQYQNAFDVKIPVVECDSLWDFFKKIGWDMKSRKLM